MISLNIYHHHYSSPTRKDRCEKARVLLLFVTHLRWTVDTGRASHGRNAYWEGHASEAWPILSVSNASIISRRHANPEFHVNEFHSLTQGQCIWGSLRSGQGAILYPV